MGGAATYWVWPIGPPSGASRHLPPQAGEGMKAPLPNWVDIGLIPVVNVLLAFIVVGLIVLAIGVNPFSAVRIMVVGAVGYPEAVGYTLYYTTNFVFTGLAVAIAFHAGLFNIGGE